MNKKRCIQILKITEHIAFVAFILLMLFWWHYLNNTEAFLALCIPSTVIFGLMQGNHVLFIKILEQKEQGSPGDDSPAPTPKDEN